MPRRLASLLEGEGLLNDATALVSLNTRDRGDPRRGSASGTSFVDFARRGDRRRRGRRGRRRGRSCRCAAGSRRPCSTPRISLAAPYVAYLPAAAIQGSGFLAVVLTGIWLGYRAPVVPVGGVAHRGAHQLAHRLVPARERRLPADRSAAAEHRRARGEDGHRLPAGRADHRRHLPDDGARAVRVGVRRDRALPLRSGAAARAALGLADRDRDLVRRRARRRHARRGVPAAGVEDAGGRVPPARRVRDRGAEPAAGARGRPVGPLAAPAAAEPGAGPHADPQPRRGGADRGDLARLEHEATDDDPAELVTSLRQTAPSTAW